MEQRQETLFNFIDKAVHDPTFVEHLVRKIESMDVVAYNKKRRLPRIDQTEPLEENYVLNNNAEFGNDFHQDFSNKLRLELSPVVSDMNLVSESTRSSNEDGASLRRRTSEGEPKDAYRRPEGLLFAPETLYLSDNGSTFMFKMDSVQQRWNSNEEPDSHISCLLNLSLASSSSQVNRSPSSTMTSLFSREIAKAPESWSNANTKDSDSGASKNSGHMIDGEVTLYLPNEGCNTTQEPTAPPVRVNDVFWEHFLTERPGSSDDEASNSDSQAIGRLRFCP
ncbi:heat stress transcription factor A-5-like [Hibiscus syriacus]|nr:heat stress transcription factor A-5-like [Hibiscus syriacus]XP_039067773.1 heat stress transcription factor A-5-like [Hibiscus syriacus]